MAESFNTNLQNVAASYLKLLRANVTSTSIKNDIKSHPYYPSLLSLSDTFKRYNIDNNAYEIQAENVFQIAPPFIAFFEIPDIGKDFILVTKIIHNKVFFLYKNKKEQELTKDVFLKRYNGIIWAAELNELSGEPNYEKKAKEERTEKYKKIIWVAAFALLISAGIYLNINTNELFAFTTIAIIKCIGLTATVLLLVYETDKSNAFVKNICSGGGKINCDSILASKASKIMGISWAEIGFFYFAITVLWLFLPVPFINKIMCLAIANAFATPYILFSLYYQWRVVKQWCLLCLVVQTVLFMELLWSIFFFWVSTSHFQFFSLHFSLLIISILFPILSWYGLKPMFIKAKDSDLYYAAYKRLQSNPEIFNSLLHQQPKVAEGWEQIGINLGNSQASNTIIKICNPYCRPCAKAHSILEEIIRLNSDVQLKIIFTARNDKHDIGAIVVQHLLSIVAEGNPLKTEQALDDWYMSKKKNYELFAAKYLIDGKLEQQNNKIEMMSKWCDEVKVTRTPTIFVNGYMLPENYNIEELKNIL